MKDKIEQWVLQCKKMYSVKDRVELIHDCIQDLGLSNEWVSVDIVPNCEFEHTEWDDDCKNCLFDGMVSSTFLITDGTYTGHGHYQDDGIWKVYQGEHDFMNIDPEDITHYMKPLPPSEAKL